MTIFHKHFKWFISFGLISLGIVAIVVIASRLNHFQNKGELSLLGVQEEVTIHRDQWGIPYIIAKNDHDLWFTQGFVTSQHRLMQMETYRRIIKGELASVIGEAGLSSDRFMRTLNIPKLAAEQSKRLSNESLSPLIAYSDGINAYRDQMKSEHPLELDATGMSGGYWTVEDIISVVYLISLTHSVNAESEILTQRIVNAIGSARAADTVALNVNPDRRNEPAIPVSTFDAVVLDELAILQRPDLPKFGSNNWVVSGEKSASGAPLVANDPHLDSRILPGIWHPVGLFSPSIQAGGLSVPGFPGIFSGRSGSVAFGVTNAYGDVQDLYIEERHPTDPEKYKDGSTWRKFRLREETIQIKDDKMPNGIRTKNITIRSTLRGPVISDHADNLSAGGQLLSLRWAASVVRPPKLGIDQLMHAKTCDDIEQAIADMDIMQFNWAFAAKEGCIGRRSSGAVPIREVATGAIPQLGTFGDGWLGFIPKNMMPGEDNPERGWTGTANHDVRPDGFPYTYSSFFSPSYRYQRLTQLLSSKESFDTNDMLTFMKDTRNVQAERILPIILQAIEQEPTLSDATRILSNWDHHDSKDSTEAVLYHTIMRELPLMLVGDQLGDTLAAEYLEARYIWLERFESWMYSLPHWMSQGVDTDKAGAKNNLIQQAVRRAMNHLRETHGESWQNVTWGDVHSVTFVSALRQEGIGSHFLGAGTHSMSGSGETLARSNYTFQEDEKGLFNTNFFVSGRMIADLANDDAILTAVAGGVTDRLFRKEQKNLITPWYEDEMVSLWINPDQARQNAVTTMILIPKQ